jgi:hypothetical protein
MGGLCVLVVRVVCAGCVCAVRPCCFDIRLILICAPNRWQTMGYCGLLER